MGYTHYFAFSKEKAADIKDGDKKFRKAVKLFKEGIKQLPDLKLCNGWGEGEPVITYEEVCFNGSAKLGEDCETFFLPLNEPMSPLDKFCKTKEKPYDVAVCLALLCFEKSFGNDFKCESDGNKTTAEGWVKARFIMNNLKQ